MPPVGVHFGTVSSLDDAVATFNTTQRRAGKTIIRIRAMAGIGTKRSS
jgi:hypothetical protein